MDASAIGTLGPVIPIFVVVWAVVVVIACVVAVGAVVRAYLRDDDPRRRARIHAEIDADNAAWRAGLHDKAIAQNRYKRPDNQPLTKV